MELEFLKAKLDIKDVIINYKDIIIPSRFVCPDKLANAGMDTTGFSIKMTRKTLECWLIAFYPNNIIQVLLSQGHTENTAINHYLSQPFTKQDKEDMKMFIEGWI